MIEIETNVPTPSNYEESDKPKWPVAALAVGESLFFPAELGVAVPHNAAQYCKRKLNRRFTVRKVEENNRIIGWRLWRVR
jgi:hypothetical protein